MYCSAQKTKKPRFHQKAGLFYITSNGKAAQTNVPRPAQAHGLAARQRREFSGKTALAAQIGFPHAGIVQQAAGLVFHNHLAHFQHIAA